MPSDLEFFVDILGLEFFGVVLSFEGPEYKVFNFQVEMKTKIQSNPKLLNVGWWENKTILTGVSMF